MHEGEPGCCTTQEGHTMGRVWRVHTGDPTLWDRPVDEELPVLYTLHVEVFGIVHRAHVLKVLDRGKLIPASACSLSAYLETNGYLT